MLKEELSNDFHCDTLPVGCQHCHLGKPINNHKNTIMTMLGWRKTRHKIHGYWLPKLILSAQSSVQSIFLNCRFIGDTCDAQFDISTNVMWEIWLVEVLLQHCHCILHVKVPYYPISPPKSYESHTLLKEHRDGPNSIEVHPRGESLKLIYSSVQYIVVKCRPLLSILGNSIVLCPYELRIVASGIIGGWLRQCATLLVFPSVYLIFKMNY